MGRRTELGASGFCLVAGASVLSPGGQIVGSRLGSAFPLAFTSAGEVLGAQQQPAHAGEVGDDGSSEERAILDGVELVHDLEEQVSPPRLMNHSVLFWLRPYQDCSQADAD